MEETEKMNQSFMLRLSAAIVDKRNLVFLIVLIGLLFSAFSRNWVQVENELAKYLPPESETRQGLDIMAEQFTTFGTADVMVANVTWEQAQKLADRIAALPGVQGVACWCCSGHGSTRRSTALLCPKSPLLGSSII